MARTNAGRKTTAPPPIPNCVETVELPGKKKITVGDPIRIPPSAPKKRDGYIGTVKRIRVNGNTTIDVWGGPGRFASMRSFFPSQVVVLSTRKKNAIAKAAAERAAAKAAGEEGPS